MNKIYQQIKIIFCMLSILIITTSCPDKGGQQTPPPTPPRGEGVQEKQLMDTLIALIAGTVAIAFLVLLYYLTKRK